MQAEASSQQPPVGAGITEPLVPCSLHRGAWPLTNTSPLQSTRASHLHCKEEQDGSWHINSGMVVNSGIICCVVINYLLATVTPSCGVFVLVGLRTRTCISLGPIDQVPILGVVLQKLTPDKLIPFELFGEPWVLFRDETGAAACVKDECAHRACPLSLGKVPLTTYTSFPLHTCTMIILVCLSTFLRLHTCQSKQLSCWWTSICVYVHCVLCPVYFCLHFVTL